MRVSIYLPGLSILIDIYRLYINLQPLSFLDNRIHIPTFDPFYSLPVKGNSWKSNFNWMSERRMSHN
jgi:hypothetical protein